MSAKQLLSKFSLKEIVKVLAKRTPQGFIASTAAGAARQISIEKFGYDFTGLGIRLGLFFAAAFLIESYFKAKIALDNVIKDPSKSVPVISGIFGISGMIFNFIFEQFKDDTKEVQVTKGDSRLFSNDKIQQLFSDQGFRGFKFWDIIKVIALLLVIMEWMRFNNMTKATGGQVQPLTHGLFVIIIIGLGLTIIPELINKVKKTDLNLESLR